MLSSQSLKVRPCYKSIPWKKSARRRRASGCAPDERLELARAFVRSRHSPAKTIHRDPYHPVRRAADLDILRTKPERGYAVEPCTACGTIEAAAIALADLIAPIIIEADGAIVPLQYNFSRAYQLGDINAAELPEQLRAWKSTRFAQFLSLCRGVYDHLLQLDPAGYPFVNWYGAMLQASHVASHRIANPRPAQSKREPIST